MEDLEQEETKKEEKEAKEKDNTSSVSSPPPAPLITPLRGAPFISSIQISGEGERRGEGGGNGRARKGRYDRKEEAVEAFYEVYRAKPSSLSLNARIAALGIDLYFLPFVEPSHRNLSLFSFSCALINLHREFLEKVVIFTERGASRSGVSGASLLHRLSLDLLSASLGLKYLTPFFCSLSTSSSSLFSFVLSSCDSQSASLVTFCHSSVRFFFPLFRPLLRLPSSSYSSFLPLTALQLSPFLLLNIFFYTRLDSAISMSVRVKQLICNPWIDLRCDSADAIPQTFTVKEEEEGAAAQKHSFSHFLFSAFQGSHFPPFFLFSSSYSFFLSFSLLVGIPYCDYSY